MSDPQQTAHGPPWMRHNRYDAARAFIAWHRRTQMRSPSPEEIFAAGAQWEAALRNILRSQVKE